MVRISIFFLGVLAGLAIFVAQRPADAPARRVVVRSLIGADVGEKAVPRESDEPTPEPVASVSRSSAEHHPAPVQPRSTPFVRTTGDDAVVVTEDDGDIVATFTNHNGDDTPDARGGETTRDDDVDPPERDD